MPSLTYTKKKKKKPQNNNKIKIKQTKRIFSGWLQVKQAFPSKFHKPQLSCLNSFQRKR